MKFPLLGQLNLNCFCRSIPLCDEHFIIITLEMNERYAEVNNCSEDFAEAAQISEHCFERWKQMKIWSEELSFDFHYKSSTNRMYLQFMCLSPRRSYSWSKRWSFANVAVISDVNGAHDSERVLIRTSSFISVPELFTPFGDKCDKGIICFPWNGNICLRNAKT